LFLRSEELRPVIAFRNAGQPDRWGYGMLWWAWDGAAYPGDYYSGPYQGAFSAMGSGGQYLTVLPSIDMVIVHKVDIDKDPQANVDGMGYDAIMNLLIQSRCSSVCR
jgi:CubicO group peptidase (beta-lactamase class C family)